MRPWMQAAMTYFYPRSPCGERPSARSLVASLSRQFLSTLSLRRATAGQFCPGRTFQISIHALLAESDRHCADTLWFRRHISIHALLAESDQAVPAATPRAGHFYPRSPCGERPHFHLYTDLIVSNFYPRSPCGERLQGQCPPGKEPVISIHALLAESDHSVRPSSCPAYRFLSTLSLRRATVMYALIFAHSVLFLSTLSLRRATTGIRITSNL